MIHLPTAWWAHYIGDLVAWTGAALAGRWQYRQWPEDAARLAGIKGASYYVTLALGALLGAWLFGSLNSLRSLAAAPSHSVAGALAGGIAGVELWKWRMGIRYSTGTAFVLSLAVGIALGRLGCLFSGLPDFTYGAPTSVPWSVDLGDGVPRHPVQLYETLAMALFAVVWPLARLRGQAWACDHAFHALIIYYAAQRFAWEFLKPYPPLVGPLNVFHLLALGMVVYGIVWWRRGDSGANARQ
jgi:phosphatidylglycerol:prolipoprotein diacylglycerol transferase